MVEHGKKRKKTSSTAARGAPSVWAGDRKEVVVANRAAAELDPMGETLNLGTPTAGEEVLVARLWEGGGGEGEEAPAARLPSPLPHALLPSELCARLPSLRRRPPLVAAHTRLPRRRCLPPAPRRGVLRRHRRAHRVARHAAHADRSHRRLEEGRTALGGSICAAALVAIRRPPPAADPAAPLRRGSAASPLGGGSARPAALPPL